MKGFEGEAATAFDNEFKTFDGRMDTFKGIVEQYVIKLREQADAFAMVFSNGPRTIFASVVAFWTGNLINAHIGPIAALNIFSTDLISGNVSSGNPTYSCQESPHSHSNGFQNGSFSLTICSFYKIKSWFQINLPVFNSLKIINSDLL